MKSEWKILQEMYHCINTEHGDDLSDKTVEYSDNIVADCLRYFTEKNVGWIYPAKSYMVAICYAKWLSEIYGDDFYSYLDDADLLYNNDPYFVPYSRDQESYDEIIKIIGKDFDQQSGMVPDVREYFEKEFFLSE